VFAGSVERISRLPSIRELIDTVAPSLGRLYRRLRDLKNSQRAIHTRYGFCLTGDTAMSGDNWEVDEVNAFLELLDNHDVVVDVGANIGFYSCIAASRTKHTVAVEPSSRNLRFLYKNLWDNRFSNVEIFPMGLGAQSGLARIYGFGGTASFVLGWAQARETHSTLVPLSTLDTIMAGRFQDKKLLIKMDVEGFELDVLAGASETLCRNPKPTWLVEIMLGGELVPGRISGKFAETFEVFWKHGYRSRKLNAEQEEVGPADVEQWIANRQVESGIHDFLFWAE
jgi:FkbM family methyltransferase